MGGGADGQWAEHGDPRGRDHGGAAGRVKACSYAYQAQTSESDLNFLTRLAKGLDAVAKPAGGYLIFSKRGEGKAADGSELPVFVLDRRQMKGGSWLITGRGKYGRVTAEWGERGTATTHKVTAGDKEPELALRHRHPTEAEAQNAADAALARSRRASGKIGIELGGFWGDLMAEAKVDIRGIKPELTGEWLITPKRRRSKSERGATKTQDVPPIPKSAPTELEALSGTAMMIKTGKPYFCQMISAHRARQCISAGLVTIEDCRKANISI